MLLHFDNTSGSCSCDCSCVYGCSSCSTVILYNIVLCCYKNVLMNRVIFLGPTMTVASRIK